MSKLKEFLISLNQRISLILEFYSSESITLSYDNLKKSSYCDYEVLYTTDSNGDEQPCFFIYGSKFFVEDLSEQEFKKYLSMNSLNFKILQT